jgi:16S rRNA (adenine1518-N6/adenine1519-N6)-dimethyltransferase
VGGRRLGQHFLYDPSLLRRIIEAADLSPDDTVVEIGPGPGAMTGLLAESVRRVVAIELDDHLYERLRERFRDAPHVELVHADVLTFPFEDLGDFKVVANIPYYITTPILFRLIEARRTLKTMTLTMQREVAERIVAGPGGKDYGVLSIMLQYHTRPAMKFIIPKEAFRPAPSVDSAVIHLTMLEQPPVAVQDEKVFFRVVRTAFAQRRKTIANSLKVLTANSKELLTNAGIDPGRRPETLSMEEFGRLADCCAAALPADGR